MEFNPLITLLDAYSDTQREAFVTGLIADWTLLAQTSQEISLDLNIGLDAYNDYSFIASAYGSVDIPRLTGIQFYESEYLGLCMGFQLIYHDISDTTFIYLD